MNSMTDTSGKINSLSIQDVICQLAKVKPATSAHHVAEVIPFLASIKPEKCFYAHSKEKVITRTSTFTFLVCEQSLLIY